MPYLILSDIHANIEALSAVMAEAAGRYDRILCLGDLVGYGADPNAVTQWARENLAATVRGNHDKACCGRESLEDYRPAAGASAVWTGAQLSKANHEYLDRLPRGPLRYEDFDLAHGSPADEDEYVMSVADAAQLRDFLGARITFFGHTHVQGGFLVTRRSAKRIEPQSTLEIEPDHFYLVNPGAVGQPRDGDPRAAYLIYDAARRTVEFCRANYDIVKAAAKVRAAGLHESLAERLFTGT
ncbi:MAG TPA: metallophosphoesterase family protein [Bryobacteraceae bacterium]|nr:metallophosphoesterase family protein [Bryobacteraceae bacterium]